MKIQDIRTSGSTLDTAGVGLHCPGSVHDVPDRIGTVLINNPNFEEVKAKPKRRTRIKKEVVTNG